MIFWVHDVTLKLTKIPNKNQNFGGSLQFGLRVFHESYANFLIFEVYLDEKKIVHFFSFSFYWT